MSWDVGRGGFAGSAGGSTGTDFPKAAVCVHVSVKRGSRKRVFVLEKRVPGGQAVGMRWPSATGNGKALR